MLQTNGVGQIKINILFQYSFFRNLLPFTAQFSGEYYKNIKGKTDRSKAVSAETRRVYEK
jgi:hypothetical protein